MGVWEILSDNMGALAIAGILVVVPVIVLIFRYLIYIKKLKGSKLSMIFFSDDESFIKSWEKIQQNGKLRYIIKNIIISSVIMGILGTFLLLNKQSTYGYEQNEALLVVLFMGVILGLINSLTGWVMQRVRYRQLKEKWIYK